MADKGVNYLVKINWKGELLTFYTTADSEKLALVNACHQLAKQIMWRPLSVYTDVVNTPHSYEVHVRPKKEKLDG